ncbi:MAG: DUF3422 domain-containing protein [Halieaceae bacterium]|jgi:uncharacterized membrane-anchored protein|nr:DUF3422 domain-containing protein [Halieaceae bacterium]
MSTDTTAQDFHRKALEERILLSNEWHARPGLRQPSPMRCSHVVTLRNETTVAQSRQEFADFCAKHGVSPPAEGSRQHSVRIGNCQVKWEGHTEAVSHTVMVPGNGQPPFSETALDLLDRDKRDALVSDMFIGVSIEVLQPRDVDDPNGYSLAKSLLGAESLYGGLMSADHAAVWSSFRLDADGFVRLVVIDLGIPVGRLSRLLQRLLEMESYRMLAIMALPRAREAMTALGELEPQLNRVMAGLRNEPSEQAQEDALRQITGIAARVERIASTHAYRFAATRAYANIVERRMQEVGENALDGHQTYSNFLLRSLLPAMRTCDATERRANELAQRVSRAANLLNTMVDMVQKKQNQELLTSMAERARLQLRLQQAVEGFSIFAISYYAVGLISYGLKAAKIAGVPVDDTLATGVAAPLVLVSVWLIVRRVRRRLAGQDTLH